MTPEVKAAIEEIRQTFSGLRVEVEPERQGGAYVIVHGIDMGDRYAPPSTWCGFLVPFHYPRSDVYPHYIDGGLRRADGRPHGLGITAYGLWQGHTALQVSRRSRRWDPAADTAAGKLLKVITWLKSQP
jgi:hypothetical protein